jgi:hypothetical protein
LGLDDHDHEYAEFPGRVCLCCRDRYFYRRSNTFNGACTGPRYNINGNAVVQTYSATTYLPGSSTGLTASGGQYY